MCVLFFYMMNRIVADRMDSFRGLGKRPLIIPLIIINVITQSLVRLVGVGPDLYLSPEEYGLYDSRRRNLGQGSRQPEPAQGYWCFLE